MIRNWRWLGLCTLFLLLSAVGCGGESIVKISGTVTRNGKPVPGIFINFEPAVGRPSWALADDQGRFTLEYDEKQKGAVAGKHTIWVLWRPRSAEEEMIDQGFKQGKTSKPADLQEILIKYGNKDVSPLKVELTKSDENFEIKLD